MFQTLRDFVHWADALMNVDRTAHKCNDVYDEVNEQLEAEEKAAKSSKETAQIYVQLLTSLMPTIVQLLTKEEKKPVYPAYPIGCHPHVASKVEEYEPVHVGPRYVPPAQRDAARPVVVDRDEQGDQGKAPAAAPASPSSAQPMQTVLTEAVLRNISRSINELNKRVTTLEIAASNRKASESTGTPAPSDPTAS